MKSNWTPGHFMEVGRHWVLDTQGVIQCWLVWGFPVESPGVRWRKQKYTDGVTVLRCSPESLDRYRRPGVCCAGSDYSLMTLVCVCTVNACAVSARPPCKHACTCPAPFTLASDAWISPCSQCFSHVRPGQIISREELGLTKCQMFERQPGCYAGIVRKITAPFGGGWCSWITFPFFSRVKTNFGHQLMQIDIILHQMRIFFVEGTKTWISKVCQFMKH